MSYECNGFKKIIIAGLSMTMIGSVAGCGASSAELEAEVSEIATKAPALVDYQVPVQVPRGLVDQLGYSKDSEKVVVFKGEDISGNFGIYDVETGKNVYTGEIVKPVYDENLNEYVSLGYFNDLEEEGQYCVYTDATGESYSFSVKEDAFKELFNEACKKYYINRCGIGLSENYAGDNAHSACHTTMARLQEDPSVQIDVSGGWHMDELARRDAALGSRIAENLLVAYEMNPSAFTDDTGIPESGNQIPDILDEVRFEAEWLLKMQDSRTGGEYAAAVTDVQKGGDVFAAPVLVTPVSMEATISFASAMARFSYFYQQYDPEFATTALKAADRAFSCFLNNKRAEDDSAAFKAAVQLYRATGSLVYTDIMDGYFNRPDFDELFNSDENIFLGAVTYLSINQKVDVERCTYLMKLLMKASEKIAAKASGSSFLVTDEDTENGFENMLKDMRCLTITDHIIYNHEYTTIIENHVHFLSGINAGAVNYLTDDTERTYLDSGENGLLNDPESVALLIFMLSVLEQ